MDKKYVLLDKTIPKCYCFTMNVVSVKKLYQPIESYPMHHHDFWEILYQLSGQCIISLEEQSYQLLPGDICVIPPGIAHEKTSLTGFTDMSIMISNMPALGENLFKIIKDDSNQSIKQLFDLALYLYDGNSGIDNIHLFGTLNSVGESIFSFLAGFFSVNNIVCKSMSLEGFVERMHANISNPDFNISEEITRYGYNVVYFRRLFKETFNMTPTAYMNKIRIDYAKNDLEKYGDSHQIKKIALACGFKDPYYFDRVFKKLTDMSPKAYVKTIRGG